MRTTRRTSRTLSSTQAVAPIPDRPSSGACGRGLPRRLSHPGARLRRGVSSDDALAVLQQPIGSYWHDGMWKEGFYDPASKVFIGQGPDGGIMTVMTNVSKAYIKRLLEAAP